MNEVWLALAFLVIGFAAAVKAAIGFGFPLIAVPIISNFLDPRTTVVVISVPTLLSNVLLVVRGGGTGALARRLGVVLASMVVGTALGAQLLARLDVAAVAALVGVASVVFVGLAVTRASLTVPVKRERYLSPIIGVVSGVLGGTTTIFGPVLAAYLHSLRLSKREFVFAISLLFTFGGVTQVLSYAQLGLYSGTVVLYALLACVPMLGGLYLGLMLQDRLPPRVWNAVVLTFIFLSGLNLIARGLRG